MPRAKRSATEPSPGLPPARVIIENVRPEIDAGRFAAKGIVGEPFAVEADLVGDGHDRVAGALLYRRAGTKGWKETRLSPLGNDRWTGAFPLAAPGEWEYTVEGWPDEFATWRDGLRKKADAGKADSVDLRIGAIVLEGRVRGRRGPDAASVRAAARGLRSRRTPIGKRLAAALDEGLAVRVAAFPDRRMASRYARVLRVFADRPRAGFSAWYEMFPRSCGPAGRHGTFRDAEERLPYVASMGFDVLYLPPIHPIGRTNRKGRNNSVVSEPGDPGSPWAIGAREGGHTAVHPDLGTLADFRRFVRRAKGLGLEVALDIAFQASPDHPWVREHPEWFLRRPDGTIQYAENPPKKYEDILPLHFGSAHWRGLWEALRDVFLFWTRQGVLIFRVDNPHTKPLPFWEWCIAEVRRRHPDVIFLSEAFTRPKLMHALAKLGFTQSYTYFTWRTSRWEIEQYCRELVDPGVASFFRPNFWPNTPDILPEHLRVGGRPSFIARLVLAATLSSNYGIYGPAFELQERAERPGTEEYIDNEKYEIRDWPIDHPESLRDLIARVNRVRRENPALHRNRTLRFHHVENDALLCYSKRTDDRSNVILVAVSLDPQYTRSGWVRIDVEDLGLEGEGPFQVHDLLSDARYLWRGPWNYVELNPHVCPAHIFRVRRLARREHDFEYYA